MPLAHTPCERRVDGERVTELIPAKEWLSRQDKNPLQPHMRNLYPPALPQYASRDHLHDRNRELCVFDPANPGLQNYVRVTRRRNPDLEAERALVALRKDRLLQQSVIEDIEADRANELLELRSKNIRGLLAAKSRRTYHSEIARSQRMVQLEAELKRIKATYEYKGYSQANYAPAAAPIRRPSTAGPTLRGGCWPVEQQPFSNTLSA